MSLAKQHESKISSTKEEEELGPVLALSGRRDLQGRDQHVELELMRIVNRLNPSVMISGLAVGADSLWANIAIRFGIALWAYVPFPQQAERFTDQQKAEWLSHFNAAARVRMFGTHFDHAYYFDRNDGMAQDSDLLVAVWDREEKTRGGTYYSVHAARGLGKPMIHVGIATQDTSLERAADTKLDLASQCFLGDP